MGTVGGLVWIEEGVVLGDGVVKASLTLDDRLLVQLVRLWLVSVGVLHLIQS